MNNKSWKRGIGWYLAAVLASVAVLTGCGNAVGQNAKKEDDGKLNVVTTLFPYYDFARQIAGDAVDLTMVVPAGMDSHSFEPTPADMRTIQNADVLICNGGAMEQWLTQVLAATDTGHMTVITMMDYVDTYEEEIVEGMEDEAMTMHMEVTGMTTSQKTTIMMRKRTTSMRPMQDTTMTVTPGYQTVTTTAMVMTTPTMWMMTVIM